MLEDRAPSPERGVYSSANVHTSATPPLKLVNAREVGASEFVVAVVVAGGVVT